MANLTDRDRSTLEQFFPKSHEEMLRRRFGIHSGFAEASLSYLAGLLRRPALDFEIRLLVMSTQFAVNREAALLKDVFRAAHSAGLALEPMVEAVAQSAIYGGEIVVQRAFEALEDLESTDGIPAAIDGRAAGNQELQSGLEREAWAAADAADPRAEFFAEKYGSVPVNEGLKLRPGYMLDTLEFYDSMDEDFTRLWLDYVYKEMFTRGLISHRYRLLCMIGGLISVGESKQSGRHMQGFLRQGGRPEEVLEVAFQGCALFGHSKMLGGAVRDFAVVLQDMGYSRDSLYGAEGGSAGRGRS